MDIRHAQNFPPAPKQVAKIDGPGAAVSFVQASASTTTQDRAFIALQNAYRAHGGLSRLHHLNAGDGVGFKGSGDVEGLFASGELFGFPWYGAIWIPMFQFTLPGPTVAIGPHRVVAELGRHFDGWALASWFVEPNVRLASDSPIECLDLRLSDVLKAARADRFVAAD